MTTYKFKESFYKGDFTHRGSYDFYPEKKDDLLSAINSGLPFDTGYGGCKHEILSVRIEHDGNEKYTCSASVSDDFDQEGLSSIDINIPKDLSPDEVFEILEKTLSDAHDAADLERESNKCYKGFSIHNSKGAWIETYIAQTGDRLWTYDEPPGDYYHQWGFQQESKIPQDTLTKIEEYIQDHLYDDEFPDQTFDGYTVKSWE